MTEAVDAIAWIEANHVVSCAAMPGPYRFDVVPYMRGFVDAIFAQGDRERIVFVSSAVMGKTELFMALADYAAACGQPAALMVPTVPMAATMRRHRMTSSAKFMAATSAATLRSRSVRYVFADETDAYPVNVRGEGDPLSVLHQKTLTYLDGREVWASTPSSNSRITREYLVSDQRRFFVSCPHCQAKQTLDFDRLRWPKGRPEQATYTCVTCDAQIDESHKLTMLQAGEWGSTAKRHAGGPIGFHISGLYSPWPRWADMARAWERTGNDPMLRAAFRSLYLAEVEEAAQAA